MGFYKGLDRLGIVINMYLDYSLKGLALLYCIFVNYSELDVAWSSQKFTGYRIGCMGKGSGLGCYLLFTGCFLESYLWVTGLVVGRGIIVVK